jgi:hypothetical protein
MKRFVFFIALLVVFTIASNLVAARAGGLLLVSCSTGFGQEAPQSPSKPCRAQPALVGKCFRVRGRLSLYNGAPTIRLWRVGTKRILGVSASYSQPGYSNIPAEIEKLLEWDNEVWGDFLVCPFTPQKPQEMQMMCIESGKNIVVRKRH